MKTRSKLLALLVLLFAGHGVWAQEETASQSFSLEQAQQYAVEHSYALEIARLDEVKAEKQVGETRAMGLPQLNGELKYQNFLNLATQLIPAQFFNPDAQEGEFIAVQFGTQHNMTAGLTLSQLIFNGSYIVALQSAQAYKQMSYIQRQKTAAKTKSDVRQAYVAVLVSEESLQVLDSIYTATSKTLSETKAMVNAGFLEETDGDQMALMLSNIESQRLNANNQLEIARKLLNYNMGLPLDTKLELTDKLNAVLASYDREAYLSAALSLEENIDYQTAKHAVRVSELLLKLEKSAVLPSLSAYLSQSYNANRNEFNFFDKSEKWFETTLLGITLNIPIFAGFERHYKIQRAKVELLQAQAQLQQAGDGLRLEFSTAQSTYNNNLQVMENAKKDKAVAKKILDRTQIKYSKGMASSMDLLQAHNQYLQKEASYFLSLQSFMVAQSELQRILTKFETKE